MGINHDVEVSARKFWLFFIAVYCLPFLSTIFTTVAGKNKYFIEAEPIAIVRWNQSHFYFTLLYYSTIASFYHIWSRERAKYETVIHCSVPVWPVLNRANTDGTAVFKWKKLFSSQYNAWEFSLSSLVTRHLVYPSNKDLWLAFCAFYIVRTHPEEQMMHFFKTPFPNKIEAK